MSGSSNFCSARRPWQPSPPPPRKLESQLWIRQNQLFGEFGGLLSSLRMHARKLFHPLPRTFGWQLVAFLVGRKGLLGSECRRGMGKICLLNFRETHVLGKIWTVAEECAGGGAGIAIFPFRGEAFNPVRLTTGIRKRA